MLFHSEASPSFLLASGVSQVEKYRRLRSAHRCQHELHAHLHAVGMRSEAANLSGTPNSRIVTRPAVGGRALRASRTAHESRACARAALESGKDGPA